MRNVFKSTVAFGVLVIAIGASWRLRSARQLWRWFPDEGPLVLSNGTSLDVELCAAAGDGCLVVRSGEQIEWNVEARGWPVVASEAWNVPVCGGGGDIRRRRVAFLVERGPSRSAEVVCYLVDL